MFLVYLDEAGNTGSRLDDPHQPIHWLAALLVPHEKVRDIEKRIQQIALTRIGAPALNTDFEFHGYDIFKNQNYFRGLPFPDRLSLLRDLLAIIPEFGLTLLFEGIDKPALARKYTRPHHPHNLAFLYLVERIDSLLNARAAWGLLIADEDRARSRTVISDFRGFKELGTAFGYKPQAIERLVDNVHFVESQNSPLIQLADCAAFVHSRSAIVRRKPEDRRTPSDAAVLDLDALLGPAIRANRIWP